MLQSGKAQHTELTFRSTKLAAFAALSIWIFGGECNPNRTIPVQAKGDSAAVSTKGIVEAFSGESISKADFECSLRTLQDSICLSLARPFKNIVDGLLSKDKLTDKSLVDEIYDCLDSDKDGSLNMEEVKKACSTIEGVKIDLKEPLPEEFKFSSDSPFSKRLQDFLIENRENLQSSRFFIRIFNND